MKRFVIFLLYLMLCSPALAEDACFSGIRHSGLAEVAGQVYGLSGWAGSMGLGLFDPAVERWSATGRRARVGQNSVLNSEIRSIDAVGDAVLIVREEKGWLELLDHSAPYTLRAELWYPATGRRVRVDSGAFALQGRLYRHQDGQLLQLAADGKTILAAWPGKVSVDWRPLGWDSFLLLEEGEKRKVLEVTSGICYDVTALSLPLSYDAQAVVEDGVMYLLGDTALTAIDLTEGTCREILTFPEETYKAFILDAEQMILLGRPCKGDPIESAVYDRATLRCTMSFTHMTNPSDALLTGGLLYLRDPYSGAYIGQDEYWRDPASASVIDLATGSEVYWELDER